MIQTYQCLDAESTAHTCLALIERCAHKFLRTGGGGLTQEQVRFKACSRTKANVLRIARTGQYGIKEIAELSGVPESTTRNIIHKAGVVVPDGRSLRRIVG